MVFWILLVPLTYGQGSTWPCDTPVQTGSHWHNENACLMVLITFGLVVLISVLTQLLIATLWKAFCFLNKIPVLMLPVVNSHKLRLALVGVKNKSWPSASSCSFPLFIPSHLANIGIQPLSLPTLCLQLMVWNAPTSLRYTGSPLLHCHAETHALASGN